MKVLIQSFSYKRTGYPKDETGKGGGFVFDCRAIDAYDYSNHVPGARYSHMHLTGLDDKVADALNRDTETQEFFLAAWTMVRIDIAKSLRRNIPVITVNFGCTAGQHRSVYLAEAMARLIKQNYLEVEAELVHLEKSHWPKGA